MFGIGIMELIMILNFILIMAAPFLLGIFLIVRMRKKNSIRQMGADGTSPFFSPDYIENQRKILEMVKQGKISTDDAEKLFAEINKKTRIETSGAVTYRPFSRRRDNSMIGGVCGAIGDHLDISPTLIRLICIILAVITGFITMSFLYMLAVFVIPFEKRNKAAA